MKTMNFRHRWVLVTGASSGLGLEIARTLARDHGAHIIAVARREERLLALKAELESQYGVQVLPMAADLSRSAEVTRLFERATEGRHVYGVVLNAGVTYYGHALEERPEEFEALLATNVTSLVHLSKRFASYLIEQGEQGGILLVSSIGCFSPLPYQLSYGATKSFVTSYGRGLNQEVRGAGVSVSVFAPGGIATEMMQTSGLSRNFGDDDLGVMTAERCARHAVQALARRKALYVPGLLNRVLAVAMKLVPHGFVLPMVSRLYAKGVQSRAEREVTVTLTRVP